MDFDITEFRLPSAYETASYVLENLGEELRQFDNALDQEHETAVFLSSFGASAVMRVTSVTYCDPNLIVFEGFVDGHPSKLIQHISQLSFLLQAVLKEDPNAPPKRMRIGFALPEPE